MVVRGLPGADDPGLIFDFLDRLVHGRIKDIRHHWTRGQRAPNHREMLP
jgi:hypothetical protein